jgi:hypothetical protein
MLSTTVDTEDTEAIFPKIFPPVSSASSVVKLGPVISYFLLLTFFRSLRPLEQMTQPIERLDPRRLREIDPDQAV